MRVTQSEDEKGLFKRMKNLHNSLTTGLDVTTYFTVRRKGRVTLIIQRLVMDHLDKLTNLCA